MSKNLEFRVLTSAVADKPLASTVAVPKPVIDLSIMKGLVQRGLALAVCCCAAD
jgi:hypothetical protein